MNTKAAQTVFVVLPDKPVRLELGEPFAGSRYFYSGNGDNLDHRMYRQVSLPAAGPPLTAQVRYDIEAD